MHNVPEWPGMIAQHSHDAEDNVQPHTHIFVKAFCAGCRTPYNAPATQWLSEEPADLESGPGELDVEVEIDEGFKRCDYCKAREQ